MTGPSADARSVRLWRQLRAVLPLFVRDLLDQAIQICRDLGMSLYLVGGPVRDAYLEQPVTDLDLVVEGDAWQVADLFHAATGGTLTKHEQFRTAVVEVAADGSAFAIDFVTARRETYAAPAALPNVTPSTIADDLRRRDFTINTLALRLDLDPVTLLDPFNGLRDIDAQLVRVLHNASFVDDPTRILRAARFAARLGCAIEPHTHGLLLEAVAQNLIGATSAQRILNELWLTLAEPQPEAVLALLQAWNALAQLRLVWSAAWAEHFAAARATAWTDVALRDVYVGLLIWPMDRTQRTAFAQRYNLPTFVRKLLRELPYEVPAVLDRAGVGAAQLEHALGVYSPLALRVLQVVAPALAAAQIGRYLETIRPLPPLLTGNDLKAQGIAPGPLYARLLAELRQLQLAGTITTPFAAQRWLAERVPDGGSKLC